MKVCLRICAFIFLLRFPLLGRSFLYGVRVTNLLAHCYSFGIILTLSLPYLFCTQFIASILIKEICHAYRAVDINTEYTVFRIVFQSGILRFQEQKLWILHSSSGNYVIGRDQLHQLLLFSERRRHSIAELKDSYEILMFFSVLWSAEYLWCTENILRWMIADTRRQTTANGMQIACPEVNKT
jgi:hypothetical protein